MFSGCGGMDLGFKGGFTFLGKRYEALPFKIIWANDINKYACMTYRHNLKEDIFCGDVWDYIHTMPSSADVIIGGFPCQDISVNNGKGQGIKGARSGLYKAIVQAIINVRPRIFIVENVKGLLMRKNQQSLEKVISDFGALGYKLAYQLYQAASYGVPQSRERVLIVGTLPGPHEFSPPPAILDECEWVTASEAIQDLEGMPENQQNNHIWSRANKSPEQGNRRLDPNKPGYTIRAECHGNIQFHYNLSRRISMREAARLQSFPDDFIFQAKLRETERQVGNAVPPLLAWHMANSVKQYLINTSWQCSAKKRPNPWGKLCPEVATRYRTRNDYSVTNARRSAFY